MPTTKIWCRCGRVLDKHGQCFLHPLDPLQGSVSQSPTPFPGFAGQAAERAKKVRILQCRDCNLMLHTSEEGDVVCPSSDCSCSEPMLELQWGPATSDLPIEDAQLPAAEDIRITLNHRELINAWRRAAILGTIAALTGWVLLLGEWLR